MPHAVFFFFFSFPSPKWQNTAQNSETLIPFLSQTHTSLATWGQGLYLYKISNISPINGILEIILLFGPLNKDQNRN